MRTEETAIKASSSFASAVVGCIYDATGDGIKEDIARHALRTYNSIPFRIWDLINTYICERLHTPNCMTSTPKRGPWQLVIIYESATGILYTVMREKRFCELRKEIHKRSNMHYEDILVRHLNSDLVAPVGQLAIFPIQFNDEDKLAENVQKILAGFSNDIGDIKRHVIILFESANFNLSSVRAIMVDSNLDIVTEQDWTQYIPVQESNVSEKVDNPNDPVNNPSRGLKFKAEAVARKKAERKKREEEGVS
jgi:hypothetical protein